jgi:hypothetical protein
MSYREHIFFRKPVKAERRRARRAVHAAKHAFIMGV